MEKAFSSFGTFTGCVQVNWNNSNSFWFSSRVFPLTFQVEKILDLYDQAAPVKPFLFYHDKKGRTSTFESVAFPGWFIASSEIGQPIFLTSELGKAYNTEFDLSIKAWTQPGGGSFARDLYLQSSNCQCVFIFIISGLFSHPYQEVNRAAIIISFCGWRRNNDFVVTEE